MAWNDYLIENGWESPRFGKWTILKSDLNYASSYSDLVFEMLHVWAGSGGGNSNNVTNFRIINDDRYPIYLLLFDSSGEPYNAALTYISPLYSAQCHMDIIINDVDYFDGDVNIQRYPLDEIAQGYPGCYPFNASGTSPQYGEIVTNMPIIACDYDYFSNLDPDLLQSLRANYLNNGDLSIFDEYLDDHMVILNEAQPPEPNSASFTIYNTGQRDIWTKAGRSFVSGPYYRWCRIKMLSTDQVDGRLAFYREGLSDGIIKLVPVSVATVVSCEYSTDGGTTWNESAAFPYEYIYGERVNELGEFISATRTGIGGDTGVPLFATRALAEGWVNHDPNVDISDALNYEDIANRYPIVNPTGAEEVATTMGDGSYLRNYFSQELVCSQGAIYEISEAFFDVGPQGLWEQIKPGIEMMGSNPIDVICGLKWFPFDLSTVLTGLASAQNYIYFGGYQFNLPSSTVRKVINHGGYLDLGSFTIRDAFPNPSDFRNFEPFCKLKIYIPTVGIQDLSYNKYRGKTVSVRLYVDIKSGSTLIALLADNVLYDFFNGSCGVDIPITLTDKAQMGQAQLRNMSNLAGVGINMGTAAATKNLGGALAGLANFESTMMDINNTSADQFNVTKGGSSPMGNGCFLPNYIYLIFEYIKTDETSNLNQLEGRITNRSGSLNSFSGYLQIDSINLRTTADMSENEKNEFVNLLQSGIFI